MALSELEHPYVTKLMEKDVELGYGIPLMLECIFKLKDAEVYPVGIQNQTQSTKKETFFLIKK